MSTSASDFAPISKSVSLTGGTEMLITFQVFPEKNYFISTWKGNITDSEMISSYLAFYQGPQWKPGLNELGDLTEISISEKITLGNSSLNNVRLKWA